MAFPAAKSVGVLVSGAKTTKTVKNATGVAGKLVSTAGKNSKVGKAGVKTGKTNTKKIHKNSHEYVGDSHVYKVRNVTKNKTHKIGESSAGVRKRDGKSKRAEAQVRKLEQQYPDQEFESIIIRNFGKKKDAYKHEGELIPRYRKTYKNSKNLLPGNKGNC